MKPTSVARVEELAPNLKTIVYQMAQMLSLKGIEMEVAQGLRTWAVQDLLYAQGRTAPGPIVTAAQGGYSWHCFSLAFDIDIVTANGLDWTGDDAAWQACIATGESLGLVSGKSWNDKPHFQLTGRFPVTPDDEVRYIFKESGLAGVWAEAFK
jgi:peptidoglycan L-alanyl-D-glutamate endopeptidase CwlK